MIEYKSIKTFDEIIARIDEEVIIEGFLYNIRAMKNCMFLILRRDHVYLQCIYKGGNLELTVESTVRIFGKIILRNPNNINHNELLGKYEIVINNIEVITQAKALPFPILHASKTGLEYRERFRFLDLRDKFSYDCLLTRIKAIKFTRKFFDDRKFLEIDTPIMTGPTENGANNYLVSSKKHPKKFYALAQSPQVYKQILMCSDIERYYQLAPCFRDEESRSNRIATEFTQVDVELKANEMYEVINLAIEFIVGLTKELINEEIKYEFYTYDEIIAKYTTDQADIRTWNKFNIEVIDSRIQFDNLDDIYTSLKDIFSDLKNQGDKLFIAVSSNQKDSLLSHLSTIYNHKYNEDKTHYMAVVTNYPFFERDENGDIAFKHHPFSLTYKNNKDETYAYQYDLLLDGQEIAGGSIREFDPTKLRSLITDKSLANFIEMYEYGSIKHGGFALGLERFLSIIMGTEIVNFVPFFTRKNGMSTLIDSPI